MPTLPLPSDGARGFARAAKPPPRERGGGGRQGAGIATQRGERGERGDGRARAPCSVLFEKVRIFACAIEAMVPPPPPYSSAPFSFSEENVLRCNFSASQRKPGLHWTPQTGGDSSFRRRTSARAGGIGGEPDARRGRAKSRRGGHRGGAGCPATVCDSKYRGPASHQ